MSETKKIFLLLRMILGAGGLPFLAAVIFHGSTGAPAGRYTLLVFGIAGGVVIGTIALCEIVAAYRGSGSALVTGLIAAAVAAISSPLLAICAPDHLRLSYAAALAAVVVVGVIFFALPGYLWEWLKRK